LAATARHEHGADRQQSQQQPRRQIAEGRSALLKGAGPGGADVLRRADLEKL